ncbi:hypothetical protein ABFX02_10G067000 [Erythranthe guttata]
MSHSSKRTTITAAINRALRLPVLLRLYDKTAHFIFPLLRRLISKSIRFMDSILYYNEDDDLYSTPFDHSFLAPSFSDPVESIFLVPFRWWKEAVCGGGVVDGASGVGGVLYNTTVQLNVAGKYRDNDDDNFIGVFGDSEVLVAMSRQEESGISGEEADSGGEGDLALVSEWMFFSALKWHYDMKDVESFLREEGSAYELFSSQIRLSYVRETRQLVIKISQKDNEVGFAKARSIFCAKCGVLQVWDFSGQTNQLFVADKNSYMGSGQSDEEILLELQIYGLSSTIRDEERRNDDMAVEQSWVDEPSSSSSPRMNGSVDKVNFFSRVPPPFAFNSSFYGPGALGLTGLHNLGNTCFMNSAIQCLVHTPKLVDYFLGNFRKDLNYENPLGMNGKLAIAFGDLLRKLWTPGATPVSPRMFKSTISSFAPRFSGYNQHDSQEFLSFLLDGLHEDLNRVKMKPYIETKDDDSRPDEEVADEYWKNHLCRNDSVIVDLYQGQYRSMLVCPVCKKLSTTFDPFMYLSLPLPSSTLRKMTLTVLSSDGTTLPHPVVVTVPDDGTFKDLVVALGEACSLRHNETFLIAEIFNNSILRVLEDPDDSLGLIRDNDQLVAYILPTEMDGSPLVVFMHQQEEKSFIHSSPSFKKFGIPLVTRISDFSKGSEIHKEFLKLLNPFILPVEESLNDASRKRAHEDEELEDTVPDGTANSNNETENDLDAHCSFEYYVENGKSHSNWSKIEMDEPVPIPIPKLNQQIDMIVSWPEKSIQEYDTSILSMLPEVYRTTFSSKWNQDSISLYKCVDAFLKEEPLGPDDMWYCPNCKEHRQAIKKLDLWRLPDILVIHLKRFSYTRFFKNKLEAFVDFPIDDFDLSNYVIPKNNMLRHRYKLYAVSNHYGGLGGGHYTAFAKHGLDRWFEFDDGRVFGVTEEQIKTQAAYVLFYKRI